MLYIVLIISGLIALVFGVRGTIDFYDIHKKHYNPLGFKELTHTMVISIVAVIIFLVSAWNVVA